MLARPRISNSVATGIIEAITAAGGDAEKVLQAVHIKPALLADREGFLACVDFARLLQEAARATGDSHFALHFAERSNPKEFGPLLYAVLNAPTVRAGYETAARYLHLHNQAAHLSLHEDNDLVYLRVAYVNLDVAEPRHFCEFGMTIALRTLRIMAGSQWCPRELQFAHTAPLHITEYLRVFGAPVMFGCAENQLVMEQEFIEKPVPAADHRLYDILKRYLDDVLSHLPPEDGFLVDLRRIIAAALRNGAPKLGFVAKQMAVSPRTLQRKLAHNGLDFKRLLDDTRRQFALDYLRDRANTLTEIAFLLGYSEVSAFNRAFKR
jgi:AraC-like DNA-binding protein